MTAKEHLAEAEELLNVLANRSPNWDPQDVLADVLVAQAHALMAIADVLGVAHTPPATGGDGSES